MSKASVSMIQTALRDLGYAPGPIDGLFGTKTNTAAQAWLLARGAPAAALQKPETSGVIFQGAARYAVDEIVVHCSATQIRWMETASFAAQFAEIRRWHMEDRGWQDIGYHWLISRSGQVLAGRAETKIGAHVVDHNRGTLGICLIGGFGSSETDRFSDHFTPAQNSTLRQLIQGIGMRTAIRRVSGHNEWAAKACPGFNVPKWLKEAA